MADADIEVLLAERAIKEVLHRYARGVDRYDLDLVSTCYWADATDDHGTYQGTVAGFVEDIRTRLLRFERTMHVLANCLIETDLAHDRARAETYCLAFHRFADGADAGGSPGPADLTAALRYVDRFERRDGEWRIADRVLAYEWARLDPVGPERLLGRRFARGTRDGTDPLHRWEP